MNLKALLSMTQYLIYIKKKKTNFQLTIYNFNHWQQICI